MEERVINLLYDDNDDIIDDSIDALVNQVKNHNLIYDEDFQFLANIGEIDNVNVNHQIIMPNVIYDLSNSLSDHSDRLTKNSIECESTEKVVTCDDIYNYVPERDNYKKLIGEGTYGKVFVVTTEDSKEIALKIPNDESCLTEESIQSVEHEIKALKQLKHENIIEMIDYEIEKDSVWFTMEYLGKNASLKNLIDSKKELSIEIIKSISRQLLKAVSYMHENYFIHCDIKSDNILVIVKDEEESVEVKLIDFGSVKKYKKNVDLNDFVNGTDYTKAPELFSMGDEIYFDNKIDIYSIGCVIIEMHTGQRKASYFGPPSFPHDISEDEKDFLKHCLDENRKIRYSADQLLEHPFLK